MKAKEYYEKYLKEDMEAVNWRHSKGLKCEDQIDTVRKNITKLIRAMFDECYEIKKKRAVYDNKPVLIKDGFMAIVNIKVPEIKNYL